MSDYKTLKIDVEAKVMSVTISNPPINLQTDQMIKELADLVSRLEADTETKVVIFRSEVSGYFIAHFDVKPGPDRIMPPLGGAPMHGVLHTRISQLRQVTIGELRGRARGSGNEFFLSLDLRYASREKAVLGQNEIMTGLHPGAGGTVRLTQFMGRSRAFEAVLSGYDYDAETAERFGWITRALPDVELKPFVDALAHRIARFPRSGIASVKSTVNQMSSAPSTVLNEDSMRFWDEIELPETQERVAWMLANGAQTPSTMEESMGQELAKFPHSAK